METLKVQSVVCLVPQKSTVGSLNAQRFIASPSDNRFQLFLNDGDEELSWTVDQCTTPDMNEPATEEKQKLINFALEGYSVSALLLSEIDSDNIFQQRKSDLELFLTLISNTIRKSPNPLIVEYAYVGITDQCVYDLRNDTVHKNEVIFEKGFDFMMRKVEDITHVWNKIKKGSRLPFMLQFKITNSVTMKQGHLRILDLLQPPFVEPEVRDKYTLYQSFSNLVDIVNMITNTDEHYVGHLNTDYYVLTHLLTKTLCGQEKASIFAYFNDRVEESFMNMVKSCMDFVTLISEIKVKMIPNTPFTKSIEYKKLKVKNAELLSKLSQANGDKESDESILKVREAQVRYLEAAHAELLHRPSIEVQKLKSELAYQKGVNSIIHFKMNNLQLDMKYLRDINEDLKADKLQLQKRMTEETRRFKEELQSTQQLASEYESRIDALTSQIQADSNFKRQYKEEYDLKYNTMYTEYKKKLEAIKSASKEREAKIKRQYKEELAKAKEALEAKKPDEDAAQVKSLNLELELKLHDADRTVRELRGQIQSLEKELDALKQEAVNAQKAKPHVIPEIDDTMDDDFVPPPEIMKGRKRQPTISRRKIVHVPEDLDDDEINTVKPIKANRKKAKEPNKKTTNIDDALREKPTERTIDEMFNKAAREDPSKKLAEIDDALNEIMGEKPTENTINEAIKENTDKPTTGVDETTKEQEEGEVAPVKINRRIKLTVKQENMDKATRENQEETTNDEEIIDVIGDSNNDQVEEIPAEEPEKNKLDEKPASKKTKAPAKSKAPKKDKAPAKPKQNKKPTATMTSSQAKEEEKRLIENIRAGIRRREKPKPSPSKRTASPPPPEEEEGVSQSPVLGEAPLPKEPTPPPPQQRKRRKLLASRNKAKQS